MEVRNTPTANDVAAIVQRRGGRANLPPTRSSGAGIPRAVRSSAVQARRRSLDPRPRARVRPFCRTAEWLNRQKRLAANDGGAGLRPRLRKRAADHQALISIGSPTAISWNVPRTSPSSSGSGAQTLSCSLSIDFDAMGRVARACRTACATVAPREIRHRACEGAIGSRQPPSSIADTVNAHE
jgi:hypothetical protein